MQEFIAKYRDEIQGTLSGFDRVVFAGALRRLDYSHWERELKAPRAMAMEQYLAIHHILYKDFAAHVKAVSERIKEAALAPFRQAHLPVMHLKSPRVDKDALAREQARRLGVQEGLVCAFTAVELHPTFHHYKTILLRRRRPCGVMYQYQFHPQVGWMYARIQTWFPFQIQVGINGREWLAHQMRLEKLQFRQSDNCFVWIEDYQRAQALLDQQLRMHWPELLGGLAEQLNPLHGSIFDEKYPVNYYWTCPQSEWATDLVFRKAAFLRELMPRLVRHGMLSFRSTDVLRYLGHKVNLSGDIPAGFAGSVEMDLKRRPEGERVKFRMNEHSAKFYDKAYSVWGSVLRGAETTLNGGRDIKVYRPKQGGPEDILQWLPLRKGIADMHRRAEVSQAANNRLLTALAQVDDSRSVEELTKAMQQPTRWKGRRVRALHPWGQDQALLAAVNRGDFLINGLRNRDLQAILYAQPASSEQERKRRSAAISRKLRMLRAHGLIQKIPRTHRYQITAERRSTLICILTIARTSLEQLNRLAEKAA
jgi:hypothetical protein